MLETWFDVLRSEFHVKILFDVLSSAFRTSNPALNSSFSFGVFQVTDKTIQETADFITPFADGSKLHGI